MHFLILAHIGDYTALRVFAALRARVGTEQVKLVSSEELALASRWSHRLETSKVTSEIRLADGTCLNSADIGVVFNRLTVLTLPQFRLAKAADRDYAIQEINALCLSWLESLSCPVINAAAPPGLSSPNQSHAEWLLLASKAGLPIQGYHFTTDPRWSRETTYKRYHCRLETDTNPLTGRVEVSGPLVSRQPICYLEEVSRRQQSVLVAGDRAIGKLAGRYDEQLKRLVRISGCDLLEITFALAAAKDDPTAGENWKVCGVSPFPYVQSVEAILAIVQLLESKQIAIQS